MIYKTVGIESNKAHSVVLMSPTSIWEAIRTAFQLWRHPDRCAVLAMVNNDWLSTIKPISEEELTTHVVREAMRQRKPVIANINNDGTFIIEEIK